METTKEIYEFTPKHTTIELEGLTPQLVEKLKNKLVTIVLSNVWLDSAEYNFITLNTRETETKLEFYGG